MSIRELGNALGNPLARSSAEPARGEMTFGLPGTYSWVCPTGVTSVSVVCVGGGGGGSDVGAIQRGGGGGALAYANNIPVTPGNSYNVTAGKGGLGQLDIAPLTNSHGGDSYFGDGTVVSAGGGLSSNLTTGSNGNVLAGLGGAGGDQNGGGGGAGGYSGMGGNGSTATTGATNGQGGAGAGGQYFGGGGGVGLFGEGMSGVATASAASAGGSGGEAGRYSNSSSKSGGAFGGGGGAEAATKAGGDGGDGVVRIIWGKGRSFPFSDVGPS